MAFSPAHDTLLLELVKFKGSSSLIVSEPKKQVEVGEVKAIGPGRLESGKVIPPQSRVGDLVFYPVYVATIIFVNDKQRVLVKEEDIFGWIRKKSA